MSERKWTAAHSFGLGMLSIALIEAPDSIYRLGDFIFFLLLLGFLTSKVGAISLLCLPHRLLG